jgi:ABC-type transport system involved in Fe-S cluster assembly fused permease/ATPase subunit
MAGRGGWMDGPDADPEAPQLSKCALMTLLKPYFWPKLFHQRVRAIASIGLIVASKVCQIWSPLYIGRAVDDLAIGVTPTENVAAFTMLVLLGKACQEVQQYIYLKVKQTAFNEVAMHTFAHLHSLSLDFHLTKQTGEVLRAIDRGQTSANNVVNYLFLRLVPTFVEVCVVCVIFATRFEDGKLAAVVFAAAYLYAHMTFSVTQWRKKFRKRMNKQDNKANSLAVDSLTNFETVKFFANEAFELARYSKAIVEFQASTVVSQGSMHLLNLMQQTVIQAALLGSLLLSAKRVVDKEATIGEFTAVMVYVMQVFAPLSFLGTIYSVIVQSVIDMQHLSQLLAREPEIVDSPDAVPLLVGNRVVASASAAAAAAPAIAAGAVEGDLEAAAGGAKAPAAPTAAASASIEFRDVTFNYAKQPVENGLKKVSFTVAPGTTTAIVGHTGAGKSSIARLLFRFYDVKGGAVLINGQDVRSVTQKSLRTAIGVVPQDVVLFNDTIGANIRYGRIGATDGELATAIETAQIAAFVETLDEGLGTKVGERGLKLSGGEKQRVAIARTLLKDPPLLLLDEATSALDSLTEREIQTALLRVRNGRTAIVIAHRLSTISDAEQIIVLERGEIVERGTHDELLALGGVYDSMWQRQAQVLSGEGGEEGEGATAEWVPRDSETEAEAAAAAAIITAGETTAAAAADNKDKDAPAAAAAGETTAAAAAVAGKDAPASTSTPMRQHGGRR